MSRPVRVLVIGTIVSMVLGVVGGFVAVALSAPFYFGFFIGFTLSGLSTLFAIAASVSGPPPPGS